MQSNADRLSIYDNQHNAKDPAAWKAYLAAQKAAGTPVTVVYRLAEPVVTQRDPARVIPPGAGVQCVRGPGRCGCDL